MFLVPQSSQETPQTLPTKLITFFEKWAGKRDFGRDSRSDIFFTELHTCTFSNFLTDLKKFDFSRKSIAASFATRPPIWSLNYAKMPKISEKSWFFYLCATRRPAWDFFLAKSIQTHSLYMLLRSKNDPNQNFDEKFGFWGCPNPLPHPSIWP